MQLHGVTTAITGGASGLGLAMAERVVAAGGYATIIDLPTSRGAEIAERLGDRAIFAPADITDIQGFTAALDVADAQAASHPEAHVGGLRNLVHCAGVGRPMRVLSRDGTASSVEDFEFVVRLNLIGSFNALSLGAERIARHDPVDGERGAIVLTASVAAYEGQIGQINYAASKGGVVSMTLVGARDLASHLVRVNTIAPGIMDTPMLASLPEPVRDSLAASVPNPHRLGRTSEFAALAEHLLSNHYMNGETVRLDGAIRMAPR